jgi:hypothetical protein
VRRQFLGIYKRDGEELKVLFSTPFGPEITVFLDPDNRIENTLNAITTGKQVAVLWDSDGIRIKQL